MLAYTGEAGFLNTVAWMCLSPADTATVKRGMENGATEALKAEAVACLVGRSLARNAIIASFAAVGARPERRVSVRNSADKLCPYPVGWFSVHVADATGPEQVVAVARGISAVTRGTVAEPEPAVNNFRLVQEDLAIAAECLGVNEHILTLSTWGVSSGVYVTSPEELAEPEPGVLWLPTALDGWAQANLVKDQ